MNKPKICYCCLIKSDNFYYNKDDKASKYCKICYNKYTSQERKNIELNNIAKMLKGNI